MLGLAKKTKNAVSAPVPEAIIQRMEAVEAEKRADQFRAMFFMYAQATLKMYEEPQREEIRRFLAPEMHLKAYEMESFARKHKGEECAPIWAFSYVMHDDTPDFHHWLPAIWEQRQQAYRLTPEFVGVGLWLLELDSPAAEEYAEIALPNLWTLFDAATGTLYTSDGEAHEFPTECPRQVRHFAEERFAERVSEYEQALKEQEEEHDYYRSYCEDFS